VGKEYEGCGLLWALPVLKHFFLQVVTRRKKAQGRLLQVPMTVGNEDNLVGLAPVWQKDEYFKNYIQKTGIKGINSL